ncbi:flippase [candidate division WWE3 bacterium]|nr:flippase [candidate division WWE3 bacterium]
MLHILNSVSVKKIIFNTAFQLLGKVVTAIITLFLTVLITRNFGRSGYGEFNIMQSFPAIFFIIADFGMNAIATRELTTDWTKAKKYLSNILSLRIILSLCLIFIASVLLLFFPYSKALVVGTQFGLFLILTQALFTTTNIAFQVKLRYDMSTIGLISGYAILFLFAIFSMKLNLGVAWVNFSYVLGGLVTFFVNLNFLKKLGLTIGFEFDAKIVKFFLLESLPLGLMFIFSQVNFRSDTLLLSVLKLPSLYSFNNTESVGIYGLAYKIFEVCLVIPTFFMNAIYPFYVKKMNESASALKITFLKSLQGLLVFGILIGVVGYIFAPFIIRALGGEEFSHSVFPLRILMGGIFVFYLTQPISWLIVTLGSQKYLPFIYLLGAVFSVSLNWYFIPRFSFIASSYITIFTEGLILMLLMFFANKAWKKKYAKQV